MLCIKCNQDKAEECFAIDKYKKKGRATYCKECINERYRKYYKESPLMRKKIYESCKGRRQKSFVIVDSFLSKHPCQKCGNTDIRVLQFHHRNPKEKEAIVSHLIGCSENKILKEISKCDILCANCHIIEHLELKCESNSIDRILGCQPRC